MYFGNVAPGGYAWVIPKKEGANVGLGYSKRYARGELRLLLGEFLKLRPMEAGKLNGKMVPMSGPIPSTVKGNALVVGDAAGQVMAVNGGGIPIAMICGRIAGQVAADRIQGGSELSSTSGMARAGGRAPQDRAGDQAPGDDDVRVEVAPGAGHALPRPQAHGQGHPLPVSFSLKGCT